MAGSSHLCVLFGIIGLAHSAYSAAQHRSYLRLTEQEFTRLPTDIFVQCIISLLLTCYGVINVAGKFREIRATVELEARSMDTLCNRPSFYCFSHRGQVLHRAEENQHG
ncbi:membrane magnesium transporter 1 [Strongylocentrotus purpuratus]|uniref:Membrane magnesium transporter n=1 Tax=Strongylocentrotus purpuratus TaxID=7668 RepID=A0A7M7GH56_STRPU|nr:membrane magnesium transporter 1 [Strongylocentrotus purpuratus]|eukprot:XP_003726305.1 PREDICTED: membrane magnesium transporter 1 [Strongylocentrotus purpuratus]